VNSVPGCWHHQLWILLPHLRPPLLGRRLFLLLLHLHLVHHGNRLRDRVLFTVGLGGLAVAVTPVAAASAAAASVAAAQAAAPTGWHAPRDVAAAAGGASVVAGLRSGDLENNPGLKSRELALIFLNLK
jgi:hypothetical protein